MADKLYTVLFHVFGHGASCTFEDNAGDAAMRLAMDLERQGYVTRVYKSVLGKQVSEETIYKSDGWVPPMKSGLHPKSEDAEVKPDGST